MMKDFLRSFDYYRCFRTLVDTKDRVYLRLREEGQSSKLETKFELIDLNLRYLTISGPEGLKIDQETEYEILIQLKKIFSGWDVFLKGKIFQSYPLSGKTIYSIQLEDSDELSYFLKYFINRLPAGRIRDDLITSSLLEKSFSTKEAMEIFLLFQSFFADLPQNNLSEKHQTENWSKDTVKNLLEVIPAEKYYYYQIKPETNSFIAKFRSEDDFPEEIGHREGYLGRSFSSCEIVNLIKPKSLTRWWPKEIHDLLITPVLSQDGIPTGVLVFANKKGQSRFDALDERKSIFIAEILRLVDPIQVTECGQSSISFYNSRMKGEQDLTAMLYQDGKQTVSFERLAHCDGNVLISGEEGLRKRELAMYLHESSKHYQDEFLVIDLHHKKEDLDHINWEDRGSLILDGIENLNGEEQILLADRIGSSRKRIFSLSHVKLSYLVSSGTFNERLYELISSLAFHLSPINQREHKIEILRKLENKERMRREGSEQVKSTHFDREIVNQWDWPGNIKEMEKKIIKSLLKNPHDDIDLEIENKFQASELSMVEEFTRLADQSIPVSEHIDTVKRLIEKKLAS